MFFVICGTFLYFLYRLFNLICTLDEFRIYYVVFFGLPTFITQFLNREHLEFNFSYFNFLVLALFMFALSFILQQYELVSLVYYDIAIWVAYLLIILSGLNEFKHLS